MNSYGHYCRPGLAPLLEAVGLDATYVRAEGDYLYYQRDGREVQVLDLLGGYGANLFGHHHPALVAEARRLFDLRVPIQAQASCRAGAARLAEALCRRLGDYVVTFTNSGAETIEAAIKHVHLERAKPVFWAIEGSFHGKTLGAIQFTWSYRQPYAGMGPQVRFLNPHDPAACERAFAESGDVAAVFLEPIAGEGGIRALPAAFASRLREVCAAHDIPIVADEIQSGMGRTGTFLASEALGLDPDYVCLGKSLGGGLVKMGALLVRRRRFVEEFSIKHTSTFAEDDFSCGVALRALELLDEDDLPARCAAQGAALRAGLEAVRRRHPDVVEEVRGQGLMIGVQLRDQSAGHSHILRMLSQQGHLGHIAAGYLLHAHAVRLAPTLTQPFTLRLEPSAYLEDANVVRACEAFDALCGVIGRRSIAQFTGYRYQPPADDGADYSRRPRPWRTDPQRAAHRVAFLGHLLRPEDMLLCEPSLAELEPAMLDRYLHDSSRLMDACTFDRIAVRSDTGAEVDLSFVGLTLTSQQIADALQGADRGWIMAKLEDAVALARREGNQVVGFGGYTSIITGNCLRVRTGGIGLTTGNSLTTGMGIRALRQGAEGIGIDLAGAALGVIGATGNIASTYATMIAPHVRELVLVVRQVQSSKLKPVLARLQEVAPRCRVTVSQDVAAIARCQLVVSASNTPDPLIYPEHLSSGPVAICDISLPSDVSVDVLADRPDVLVIRGGIVKLPHDPQFAVAGIALPRGHALACMSETLLMGLEGLSCNGTVGAVTEESVRRTLGWADRHGFALGELHVTGTPHPHAAEPAFAAVRSR